MKTPRPDPIAAARQEIEHTGVDPASFAAPPGEGPGDVIDRYRLLEEIGEGGMGTVWMAQQSEPLQRRVALKVIKLGMDTRQVVARFEAERQALALMDHAHIAKVLDGGATAGGRPYFVMELVRGTPITDYCDAAKASLPERLALFTQVCAAIQHAHHKGLIHRDIKPSNVLVTLHDGVPVPKVIDFGIAKATNAELTQKTMFTRYAQILGTPEYMAPEQAEMSGIDIDTRADVYSLGVLLYELLTGTKPFDQWRGLDGAYDDMLRTIREVDPAKPSTRVSSLGQTASGIAAKRRVDLRGLERGLRGDLDWIVMRALEKDRTRRYETANGLAADVGRFLNQEPVLAAPPSILYRLRKFVRRRRKTVVVAVIMLSILVAGAIGTGIGLWRAIRAQAAARTEAERATRAESLAATRADELEQVASFQAEQLRKLDVEGMGVRMRRALIEAADEERRAELEAGLSGVNFTDLALDTLDGNLFGETLDSIESQFAEQPLVQAQLLHTLAETQGELGLYRQARDVQERALAIRRTELGEQHSLTLSSQHSLGVIEAKCGKPDEAERLYLSVLEGLGDSGELCAARLQVLGSLGELRLEQGRLVQAEALMKEQLDGLRKLHGDEHMETLRAHNDLAAVLGSNGKVSEAGEHYRIAYEGCHRLLGADHTATLTAINNMGVHLADQGRMAEAEPYYRRALAAGRRVRGDDHPLTLLAIANLGAALQALGNYEQAEVYVRESLERSRSVLGPGHPATLTRQSNLAYLLRLREEWSLAEPLMRSSLEGFRRTLGDDHPDTLTALHNLGALLEETGRLDEAESFLSAALLGRRRVLGPEHSDSLASAHSMGYMLLKADRLRDAESWLTESLDASRRLLGERHPDTLRAVQWLGELRRAQGEHEEAERWSRAALVGRSEILGDDHPETLFSVAELGVVLRLQGRVEEALPHHQRALEGRRRVLGNEHGSTLRSLYNMGTLLADLGHLEGAVTCLREVFTTRRSVLGDGHPETLATAKQLEVVLDEQIPTARGAADHPGLARALLDRGRVLLFRSRHAEAEERLAEAVELLFEHAARGTALAWEALGLRGEALAGLGRRDEAEPLLLESAERLLSLRPEARSGLEPMRAALQRVIDFYGDHDEEARAWRLELEALEASHGTGQD